MPGILHLLRQTAMGQNRMGRYIAYGLGEIVLLVIGILLALQINNWNEQAKERVEEIAYLKKLQLDLQQNRTQSVEVEEYHDYMILQARWLLDALAGNPGGIPLDTLAVGLELAGWTRNAYFVQKVWDELHATGNAWLIENSNLQEQLTVYYQQTKMYKAEESECNVFNHGIRRLTGEVLSPDTRFEIMDFLHPFDQPTPVLTDLEIPDFIETLREIDGVQGYLVDLIECRKTSKFVLLLHRRRLDSLLEALGQELKSLKEG